MVYLIRLKVHIDKTTGRVVAKWSEEETVGGGVKRNYYNNTFANFSELGAYLDARYS